MSDSKDRRSSFLKEEHDGEVVEFDDAPDAIVLDTNIKSAKLAGNLAGENMSFSEFKTAKVIYLTLDKETREPYFDEEDYESLLECRGKARVRLERLIGAVEKNESMGN